MTPSPLPPEEAAPDSAQTTTPAQPRPPESGGVKPVHLVAVAAAIAGGALATLLLMDARPSAGPVSSPTGSAVTAAPGAPGPSNPGVDLAAPAKWSSKYQAKWVNPSRTAAAFQVDAERPVAVWNATVTPTLVVRCTKGRVDAFVYTNSAARIEPEDDDHTVKLAFDEEPGTHERWPDSIEHDALFAPDGRALAERLSSARSFRFTFAPHHAGPATALFDVRGLKEKMAETRACRR